MSKNCVTHFSLINLQIIKYIYLCFARGVKYCTREKREKNVLSSGKGEKKNGKKEINKKGENNLQRCELVLRSTFFPNNIYG